MKRVINYSSYVWQPALAFVFVWGVMLMFSGLETSTILSIVGSTSLASSAMIIFASPCSCSSRSSNIIGGYSLGIICGVFGHFLVRLSLKTHPELASINVVGLAAALAVLLVFLLMCILRMEHPPAAGIALGLVIEPWDYSSLEIIFISVLVLSAARYLLKPILRPLL